MKLSPEILATFIGGQIEIQNEGESYYYRGEIRTAEVTTSNELAVTLHWMAKGDGFPPATFEVDDRLDYKASLDIYSVSDIGPGRHGGGGRIALMSSVVGETVVLFPPDGSKLDITKVRGLQLPPVAD